MVRFEFNLKKSCLQGFFDDLEGVSHKYELRYGVFHGGVAHAEILTYGEARVEIENVLTKHDMRYELERVL